MAELDNKFTSIQIKRTTKKATPPSKLRPGEFAYSSDEKEGTGLGGILYVGGAKVGEDGYAEQIFKVGGTAYTNLLGDGQDGKKALLGNADGTIDEIKTEAVGPKQRGDALHVGDRVGEGKTIIHNAQIAENGGETKDLDAYIGEKAKAHAKSDKSGYVFGAVPKVEVAGEQPEGSTKEVELATKDDLAKVSAAVDANSSDVTEKLKTKQDKNELLSEIAALKKDEATEEDKGVVYQDGSKIRVAKFVGAEKQIVVEQSDSEGTGGAANHTYTFSLADRDGLTTTQDFNLVTVNQKGIVTGGRKVTKASELGLTDVVTQNGGVVDGLLKYANSVREGDFDDDTLVTKRYADNVALGFVFHQAAKFGFGQNIEGEYKDGEVEEYKGQGATFTITGETIADQAVEVGQRILLVGQTDKKQNGVYEVQSVDDGKIVLVRAKDMDGFPAINYNGASFLITHGAKKGEIWRVSKQGVISFGTDEIEMTQTFTPTPIRGERGIVANGATLSIAEGDTVKVIGDKVEVTGGEVGQILVSGGAGVKAEWKKLNVADMVTGVIGVDNGGTGNSNDAESDTFKLGTKITLNANASGSNVTLPQNGTLATLGQTETLTNKTIKSGKFVGNKGGDDAAITVTDGNLVGAVFEDAQSSKQSIPQIIGFVIDGGEY